MTEEDLKAKVAEQMRALIPPDFFRPVITMQEPTEADRRERRLGFTVEVPIVDQAMVTGLAESLIRKHLGIKDS